MKVTWEKNPVSFMHLLVDTTDVRVLEEEKAKVKCQNIMLASVSHEFRTPLNAFDNSLQLIKLKVDEMMTIVKSITTSKNLVTKFDEIRNRINKFIKIGNISSKLLIHLVEDILDLGKFESGTFTLNASEFAVSDIVNDINYIFENQFRERGLIFQIKVKERLKISKFVSDVCRIRQVLINLISNSFKFTQEGSITLMIEQEILSRRIFLKFSVIDTGVGISKKDQSRLFKMFSMLDQHKKKMNQKGTGIGLAISKKIVESLGGEITVESEENECTCFSFTVEVQQNKSTSDIINLTLRASKNDDSFINDKNFKKSKTPRMMQKIKKFNESNKYSSNSMDDFDINGKPK
jgi:two-component system, sensor histidine kinase